MTKTYGQAKTAAHIFRCLLYTEASSSLSSRFPGLPLLACPGLLTALPQWHKLGQTPCLQWPDRRRFPLRSLLKFILFDKGILHLIKLFNSNRKYYSFQFSTFWHQLQPQFPPDILSMLFLKAGAEFQQTLPCNSCSGFSSRTCNNYAETASHPYKSESGERRVFSAPSSIFW